MNYMETKCGNLLCKNKIDINETPMTSKLCDDCANNLFKTAR